MMAVVVAVGLVHTVTMTVQRRQSCSCLTPVADDDDDDVLDGMSAADGSDLTCIDAKDIPIVRGGHWWWQLRGSEQQ
jgi:hypothetical protein